MQQNLRRRHAALKAIRGFLDGNGFVDIDGAGVDQTRKLVDLITSNGGIVDAKMV